MIHPVNLVPSHLANGNLTRCHGVNCMSNYLWLHQSGWNQKQKLNPCHDNTTQVHWGFFGFFFKKEKSKVMNFIHWSEYN